MTKNSIHKPEILAPAGSFEILKRAFRSGADACYLGAKSFGARAYATNFSEDELLKAIEYAQIHDKKIYLTVNTLLKETEIKELPSFLLPFYRAGLDGVIVQDLGVSRLIHRIFPELPIHISTQMSLVTPDAAELLRDTYGITRVVPARELSFAEMRALKEKSGLELEVFVHGALCVCYSGQCLMSSLIGGRSGNRGMCAQPCRRKYKFGDRDGYFLSPKDLCTLSLIPEYMESGFDSYKIEGRMKNAEYVVSAVSAYRRAVDLYSEICLENSNYSKEERAEVFAKRFDSEAESDRLRDIFNRGGFTKGYAIIENGPQMMDVSRNNHNGLYVGKVSEIRGGEIKLSLDKGIHPRDVLEIRTNAGNVELTCGIFAKAHETPYIRAKELKKIRIGDFVYRTKNHVLCEQLLSNSEEEMKEKIRISVCLRKDLPVIIRLSCNGITASVSGSNALKAQNRPVTEEVVREKIAKIGDYPFEIEELEVECDPDVFYSMKELNGLKREAYEELIRKITNVHKRLDPVGISSYNDDDCLSELLPETLKSKTNTISVFARDEEQVKKLCAKAEVDRIELSAEEFSVDELEQQIRMIQSAGKQAFIYLPRILRGKAYSDMESLVQLTCDGFTAFSFDGFAYLCKHVSGKMIVLEPGVYAYNREAVSAYLELAKTNRNLLVFTVSPELSEKEIRDLTNDLPEKLFSEKVTNRIQVMITKQCMKKTLNSCDGLAKPYSIVSEQGDRYFVKPVCKYCYTVIEREESDTDAKVMQSVGNYRYEDLSILEK